MAAASLLSCGETSALQMVRKQTCNISCYLAAGVANLIPKSAPKNCADKTKGDGRKDYAEPLAVDFMRPGWVIGCPQCLLSCVLLFLMSLKGSTFY